MKYTLKYLCNSVSQCFSKCWVLQNPTEVNMQDQMETTAENLNQPKRRVVGPRPSRYIWYAAQLLHLRPRHHCGRRRSQQRSRRFAVILHLLERTEELHPLSLISVDAMTWAETAAIDMQVWKVEKKKRSNEGILRLGEIGFSKEEPTKCVCNTKWQDLKTSTYK